jgi:hypothetical protein
MEIDYNPCELAKPLPFASIQYEGVGDMPLVLKTALRKMNDKQVFQVQPKIPIVQVHVQHSQPKECLEK